LLRPAGVPGKYFFHFGQLCERKGTDLDLDISDELRQEGVKILIAGTPKDQKLFERIKCSDVVYLGALSRQEVMSYLLGSLCAILPSRADNLPNTAIESLMLGVPVLTLSKNGVDEIVEDGVNGWVVPMGSKDGLSNVLRDIWCGNTRVRGPVQLPSDMSFDLTFSVFEENINNCS
jgi:glycosyltransferase involved in cell wall biosynthesis